MKGPIILPDKTSKTLLMFLSTMIAIMGFWIGYLNYQGNKESKVRAEQVLIEKRLTAVEGIAVQVKDLPVAVARIEEIVKRTEVTANRTEAKIEDHISKGK